MNERNTPDQPQAVQQPRVEQGTIGEQPDTGFLPEERMTALRERWNDVQTGFVDDLVQTFTQERSTLENQWKSGGEADTETLRVALQRYRSFFNRLLGTS